MTFVAILLAASIPAALAATDTVSGARRLMADGRIVEAEQSLAALAEKKGDLDVWVALAEVRLELQDAAGAETAVDQAMALHEATTPKLEEGEVPERADLWMLLGRCAMLRGDQAIASGLGANEIKSYYADAEVRFERTLKLDPAHPDVRWMLGWAKELQEYPDRAEPHYREQIEKFPKNPAGYRRLGALLTSRAIGIDGGRGEASNKVRNEGIAVLDAGLAKAGPDAESLYYKGVALEWQGKRSDAIQCYLSGAKADPRVSKNRDRLAELKVGDETLKNLAKEVFEAHPDDPTAASGHAYYLNAAGRHDEAVEILLPLLEKHRESWPVFQQAWVSADALVNKRDAKGKADEKALAKGLALFAKLDELYALHGGPANFLGLYHRDVTRNYAESLKWYLRAVEKEPLNQNYLNDCALIYLFHFKDQAAKGLPMLLKAVSIVQDDGYQPDTGYWDALENLSKYYWEIERDPQKVVRYARMRYEATNGVEPYNQSPQAMRYGKLAEAELEKKGSDVPK